MSVIIKPTGSMSFASPQSNVQAPTAFTSPPPPPANEKTLQDIERLLINYITGKPDLALEFNADRLITHEYNAAGNLMYLYDVKLCKHMRSDPLLVVDNKGNAVVMGPGPGNNYIP